MDEFTPVSKVGGRAGSESEMAVWIALRKLRDASSGLRKDLDAWVAGLPDRIAVAVAAYLQASPPPKGDKGNDATDVQVAAAAAAYLKANPPAAGKNATTALGAMTWGQSAVVVVAGVRTLRVVGNSTTNAGVAAARKGDPLMFVPTPGTGLPVGYMEGSVVCPEDGEVDVTFMGPALTALQKYVISGNLYRLNP